jgi:precorrin-3B methylase
VIHTPYCMATLVRDLAYTHRLFAVTVQPSLPATLKQASRSGAPRSVIPAMMFIASFIVISAGTPRSII